MSVVFNETPCPHCGSGEPDQGFGYGCFPDCPTLTEPAAITKALAERGPPYAAGAKNGTWDCLFCLARVRTNETTGQIPEDPANHDPSCLWRRAKVLYP